MIAKAGKTKKSTMSSLGILIGLILTVVFIFTPALCYQSNEPPYSIHVASFQNLTGVYAMINLLKKEGCQPYYKRVNIPKKGSWYRVFAGVWQSRDAAVNMGHTLLKKRIIENFEVSKCERPVAENEKRQSEPQKTCKEQTGYRKNKKNEKIDVSTTISESPASLVIREHALSTPKANDGGENSLLDQAVNDYQLKKYGEALQKFNEILGTAGVTPHEEEVALRHSGDCYYFMATNGEKKDYFKAVENYRRVIDKYPRSDKENALTRMRLARIYEHLKMYYEALRELKTLTAKHPDSACIPEATYLTGELYYKTQKYPEAVEKFREYLKRFNSGKYVRNAYFYMGDSYSRMNKFEDADHWYDEALKKWPDLEELSCHELMSLGSHYFRNQEYEQVLDVFFTYVNLYPDDAGTKGALFTLARSYTGAGEENLGLKMLSLLIEKYPGSMEAKESAIVMANMGISYPDIKVPRYILSGMDYYHYPLDTYDKIINEYDDPIMKADIMFQEGCAYLRKKRYGKAFESFYTLLRQFSVGRDRNISRKHLVESGHCLIDQFFPKEDFLAIANIYFKTRRNGLFEHGDFQMLSKIGESLQKMGLLNCARGVYEEMLDKFSQHEEREQILLAKAKVDYEQNHYGDAKNAAIKLIRHQGHEGNSVSTAATELMGDIYGSEGLFKKAASSYSMVLDSPYQMEERASVYKKYADSLWAGGFVPSSLINYKKAVRQCSAAGVNNCGPLRADCYEGLGQCFYHEGLYDKSIEMYRKSLAFLSDKKKDFWHLYWMGRSYINLNDTAEAHQIFSSLRERSQDEFWSAVINYCIEEKDWTEKYDRYVMN